MSQGELQDQAANAGLLFQKFKQRDMVPYVFFICCIVPWNDLCDDSFTGPDSVAESRAKLKTHLFNKYFQPATRHLFPSLVAV